MAGGKVNDIVVNVQITIMSGVNGIPYSTFSQNNPFIRFARPLPYLDMVNMREISNIDKEIFWVTEEELTIDPPALDLKKAFNCFDQIHSRKALYSIKLCVDVPYNDKPTLLDYNPRSDIGHTFIVLTKSNSEKTVTQVFGFYASVHPGYIMPFRSLPSTIKNNQLREINASIEMALTEEQFDLLRKKAFELVKKKFNASSYNCTNFGLDLFNSVRSTPITVEKHTVYLPTVSNVYGTSKINTLIIEKTPQKLFKKLREMNDNKSADIVIDQTKNTKAPKSNGKCD